MHTCDIFRDYTCITKNVFRGSGPDVILVCDNQGLELIPTAFRL